jgi:hypothetical protein
MQITIPSRDQRFKTPFGFVITVYEDDRREKVGARLVAGPRELTAPPAHRSNDDWCARRTITTRVASGSRCGTLRRGRAPDGADGNAAQLIRARIFRERDAFVRFNADQETRQQLERAIVKSRQESSRAVHEHVRKQPTALRVMPRGAEPPLFEE